MKKKNVEMDTDIQVCKVCEVCLYIDPYIKIHTCKECNSNICERCSDIFKQYNPGVGDCSNCFGKQDTE